MRRENRGHENEIRNTITDFKPVTDDGGRIRSMYGEERNERSD